MINYYLLTKPGIILGNLLTVAAGFLLAAKGDIRFGLFFATLAGIALVMASACVFNNFLDQNVDQKMRRTKQRALVRGLITDRNAVLFGTLLGLLGAAVLLIFTNLLTVFIAAIGFFVYVFLYTIWKCKTIYGTAIGSIAGATPPVIGYCAASNQFDAGALILFAMMVLWQMPHFFSIAMLHYDDYAAAEIPVLPVRKGFLKTKIHMVIYILGFILASAMLTAFHYTGYAYLAVALLFGISWLWLCLKGFKTTDDHAWSRHMFRLSLALITAISFAIPLDVA